MAKSQPKEPPKGEDGHINWAAVPTRLSKAEEGSNAPEKPVTLPGDVALEKAAVQRDKAAAKREKERQKERANRPALQLFRAKIPIGSRMKEGTYALLINRQSLAGLLMEALKKGIFPKAKDFVLEPDILLPDMNAWFPKEPGAFGVAAFNTEEWEERPWHEAPLYIEAVLRYLLGRFPTWGEWACTDADRAASLEDQLCHVETCMAPLLPKRSPATARELVLKGGKFTLQFSCELHTHTPVKYIADALNVKYRKG